MRIAQSKAKFPRWSNEYASYADFYYPQQ